jgi:hypothetical protein
MVSPLDVSGSAVDEIVNQKVMEMMQQYDDEQINIDREFAKEMKQLK